MKITSLKNTITSGGNTYPLFICFISAKDVLKISAVPNFAEKDTHESIAKNLMQLASFKFSDMSILFVFNFLPAFQAFILIFNFNKVTI